jgi:LuxR family maltose regulon positive regulatory protein
MYLERPQIDRLLEKQVQRPIVIVKAGAGYGKTHSVYSFARKYDAFTTWMQLSERDNTGERFWENFIATIAVANKKAAAKLEKISFPTTDRQFERYLEIPQMDVPAGRTLFVYDDFHLITNPAVLWFMERSVTSPFPTITSILISRTEPPLNLVKFLSKGLLGRITEDDLRFSQEEMVEYFHIQNIRLSPQAVSSIYRDTEGWAFAIHLAGLSLRKNPPGTPYVPQAMRVNIFRLIESEVMSAISPGLRKFLVELSLVEYLVSDLLKEIAAGISSGEDLVEEMERIISFIRFDIYQNAYQIHHLLLEYLREKQRELSEEEKREVYRKTAAWCAVNNQKMDAISYYEKAGDYERIVYVIGTMPPAPPNRTARMLLEILDRMPAEVYDKIPTINVPRIQLYVTLELFEKAREEATAVIARLETLPVSPGISKTLSGCYTLLAFIGLLTSSYTRNYDFVRYFEKSEYFLKLNPFEVKRPASVMALGSYLCRVNSEEAGEMEKYIEAVSALVAYAPLMGGCGRGMDELTRGELAFFRGDLSGAEKFTLKALQNAREGDQYEIENRALFYLLRINLARGNYQAIGDVLRQLETQLDEELYLNRFTYHDIVTGWYYAHTGQTDKLAPWLKNDFEKSDLNSLFFGLEILVKAKYHFAEKRFPAVLAVLGSWETSSWAFVLGRIERKALEAVSRYRMRDKEGAFDALAEACRLAGPNAVTLPFTELGKDMRALADTALKEKAPKLSPDWLEKVRLSASGYAKKLFTVTGQDRPAPPGEGAAARSGSGLSRREMEVLANLSRGMTQEEIAGVVSLSVNTVKSIIRSVYIKLDAVNKADAIRIAVSRGLL